ncbi:MAG: permease [Candidatus Rokubacteria bacterium RIFCSPLOWO2_12_FULL_71_19]|nr:MAG: permease [Candidatus Rokubacteria bacterium RIFCSPLOWO2_12_FULL_71_19]
MATQIARPIAVIPASPRLPGSAPSPSLAARLARLDRVMLAIGAIVVGLAVLRPTQAWDSVLFAARALVEIAPWLVVSVFFAAGAKATGADGLVARAFEGREARMIASAAVVGALSPFCSCGVIPVVAGLLGAGVPLGPVMAFWIASPLMDPNMFILTTAQLGLGFTLAKTAAAIGMGAVSGFATMALVRSGVLRDVLRARPACGCGSAGRVASSPVWRFWEDGARSQVFLREAAATTWFLGRWLALAFVLESLMLAWVPPAAVAQWVGQGGPYSIPLAVLIGVPAYLNGFAAIPLVAGLIDLGMSPAAGLAFMLAGGVTSIPAMVAVSALVRPRVFALYLALAAAGALVAAYAYEVFLRL